MAEPKCPECGVAGVEHFVSKESAEQSRSNQPWFIIVHCNQCGHVHDILAKHVFQAPVMPRLRLPDRTT